MKPTTSDPGIQFRDASVSGIAALNELFARQKSAQADEGIASLSVRRDRLKRTLDLVVSNEARIADAMMSDFGYRSPDQSFFVEVVTTAKPIKEAIKNLKKWMRPEKRSIDLPFMMAGGQAEIRYQPLGVVGCISPWNFPFNLTFGPLANILAAGNRAMLKPSEITPASAALIAELVASYFDETEVAVVTGGADVSAAFSALPFDHLLYTGGERVAKAIMKAAADNLTPLTLELGGKSPVIIGKDANLKRAADRILFGKMLNAGQICLAPDYVFVPEASLDTFIQELKSAIARTAPEDRGGKDFVSVVNNTHADRLRSGIEAAKASGAQVISFDWLTHNVGPNAGNVVPLTLIINPDASLKVMTEEIFGPVLPICTYGQIDEAIAAVNSRPHPLALYYFGKNDREAETVLNRTRSGGVTINDVIMHYTMDDLPFGGVGASGMGAYHGFDGFKRFSHARAIYRQSPFDIGAMLRPPYGQAFQRFARLHLKHG